MSKKSRRRNRRILGALAALGGAAMLANRRRNQANVELDLPKSNTFTKPNMLDVAGGKTIKNIKSPEKKANKFPLLKVTDRGNVIKKGVDTGVGNMKTKFVGGDGKIFQGGVQVGEAGKTSPGISVRDDGSIMAKGVLYPNKAAYANRNKVNKMESVEGVTIPQENFNTSEFDYFAKGGRVKKKPFAKRGFGRAYKRSK